MIEAPISQSPHAMVPPDHKLTEDEERKMYQTRLDETFKPYTMLDILTKVFHRSFSDDLSNFLGEHLPLIKRKNTNQDVAINRIWVNECRVSRIESLFFQRIADFYVEIRVDTRIKIEEVRPGFLGILNRYNITPTVWLQYKLDLRPCHMEVHLTDVLMDEKDSMLARFPDEIRMDKQLLPVLKTSEDYDKVANVVLDSFYEQALDQDIPIDAELLGKMMGMQMLSGDFKGSKAQGEFFFAGGIMDIISKDDGEIHHDFPVKPWTIVMNEAECVTPGSRNTTLLHEESHGILDRAHFFMQKMHGHQYCSYVCKKYHEASDPLSAIDIMEIQANTLPGHIAIRTNTGKTHAADLLKSYGGERSLANMRRLIDDMAEFYHVTKTVARRRLVDFGYTEAKGIMQTANGELIPGYLSDLGEGKTYDIDEKEAIREYIRNPKFREMIDSGMFVYAEGHFCLNTSAYVYTDHLGHRHLTQNAREQMDQCCLVFETVYHSMLTRLINGIVQKNVGRGRREKVMSEGMPNIALTEEGKKLRRQMQKSLDALHVISKTFNEEIDELIIKHKTTNERLAEETGLSRDTIKNMRNNPTKLFPIEEIVAVCIGLHLDPLVSQEILKKAPTKLLDTLDHLLYRYALKEWSGFSVERVNRMLMESGARPLTTKVEVVETKNGVTA